MRQLLLCCMLCYCFTSNGQALKKYPVANTGCSAYWFCDPHAFHLDYSEDSSKVFTATCKPVDSLTYGLICVELKESIVNMEVAEQLLETYLDYLKTSFEIVASAGYGKGHRLKEDENTRGMLDYWKDKDGGNWKIKGWTNGKFLSVLYVAADAELNETPKINLFLDGFRFPGM